MIEFIAIVSGNNTGAEIRLVRLFAELKIRLTAMNKESRKANQLVPGIKKKCKLPLLLIIEGREVIWSCPRPNHNQLRRVLEIFLLKESAMKSSVANESAALEQVRPTHATNGGIDPTMGTYIEEN